MAFCNLNEMFDDRCRQFADRPALVYDGDDGEAYRYRDLHVAVAGLADRMIDRGLRTNDRVMLLCESRPRWGVAFFAALRAGAIVVPVDTGLSERELARLLDDARPRMVLASASYTAILRAAFALGGSPADLLCLDDVCDAVATGSRDSTAMSGGPGDARDRDDVAVMTYTSGTTGDAKAVQTTHGNLLFQIEAIRRVFGNDEDCSTVSILPLSHLFELTAGFLGVLYGGGRIRYCSSLLPTDILRAMAAARITSMVTVPLFLSLLEQAIRAEVARYGRARRVPFRLAVAAGLLLPMTWRRRLFARLHRRFGGACEYFVCGGAPLGARTERFFRGIGLPVYQGYGLAEASPIVATNSPAANRPGSVGRPLPGVEVRIDAQRGSEIMTRGPHVMRGYDGATAHSGNAMAAGAWLRTGDIGHLDADGYLHVRGRLKNVIVLGSGKKVLPEVIESGLFAHADIAEGCVVGARATRGARRGHEEVCAIVVPATACAERFGDDVEARDAHLLGVVKSRAGLLPRWQRPTRILVHAGPLPRTPTRKLRRLQLHDWIVVEGSPC